MKAADLADGRYEQAAGTGDEREQNRALWAGCLPVIILGGILGFGLIGEVMALISLFVRRPEYGPLVLAAGIGLTMIAAAGPIGRSSAAGSRSLSTPRTTGRARRACTARSQKACPAPCRRTQGKRHRRAQIRIFGAPYAG